MTRAPLNSARLMYRAMGADDAPALHAMVSQWEIASQKGSWPWPADYAFTLSRAALYGGEGFVWGIFLQGQMIGNVAITKGELGYFIDPAHQRRGYAREAVGFAMAQSGLTRIEAEVWVDNPASLALLHSLGFVETGRSEHLSKARGIRLGTIRLAYSAPHP
jgi:[ribosomal protein S5]-alanine N-acetyltransferase